LSRDLPIPAPLAELIERIPALAGCASDVVAAFELLRGVFAGGGKLLLCGNGGSAADCEHFSGELLKGFCSPRTLSPEQVQALGEPLGRSLQGGLPAVPLPSLVSATSAFANDVEPRFAFAQCVWALGRPGDALLGLSTSGDADNVCLAAQAARARGLAVLGLTGRQGGRLAGLVDVCVRAPETSCHRVQELHLPIYHCLTELLEREFFPEPTP